MTQSQAAFIEKQIEEEMREIVSELNMNAMMFDPTQPIDSLYQPADANFGQSGFELLEAARRYRPSERPTHVRGAKPA
jgi:hypothetical protein